MLQYSKQIFSGLIFLLLLSRCAQVGQLTGGKRDQLPPKLVKAEPAQKQLDYHGDQIVLFFDEFIRLADIANQLIISPKIKTVPEVTTEGKKINIKLNKDDLSPNTTYRFNFGNAVVDMHEGNPLKNFEYVFSTGPYIDSLQIHGNVTEAFNGKSGANVLVALYNKPAASDSLPYNFTPEYISKTNESGEFAFSNLPYSTYRVYAFSDKNKNQLYDGESEKIAFLNEQLNLQSDSTVELKLFQEEANKTYIKKSIAPYAGLVQVFLNKRSKLKIEPLKTSDAPNLYEKRPGEEKDTALIYYRNLNDTLGLVVKNLSTLKTDTLLVPLPKENNLRKRARRYNLNIAGGKIPLNEKVRLSFLNWMDTSKTNWSRLRLWVRKDSVLTQVPVTAHWLDVTTLELDNKLAGDVEYKIKTDTTTFYDAMGRRYDSTDISFKVQTKAEFGKVILKMLFNKKQSYQVQLINDQEAIVKEQAISFSLSSSNAVTVDFTDVPPGTYFVKIIFDDNGNKKWDTGSLLKKRHPERAIVYTKQIKVMPDWEAEEEIVIKD